MRDVDLDIDSIRIFLHLAAATVWIGGQVVLGALAPLLRGAGDEQLPRRAARRFATVAWPAFVLLVVTGIWSLVELPSDTELSYQATLGIKLLLAALSGAAAGMHGASPSPVVKAVTGATALVAALGALFCGVLLVG